MRSEDVKIKALALGFELVGVARADDPFLAQAMRRYSDWVKGGHGATMDYLRRHTEIKSEPARFLTEARSVVCVGMLYGAAAPEPDATRAQVSLYTRGEDYHQKMRGKLNELVAWLEHEEKCGARAFVDAEPVLERFWAWRAGLGWLGKNTLLINRKLGSYFFLGGVVTSAELLADEPDTDHCGRCRKCIEACPTTAITEERFIESARCIGYHTIENRGEVPAEIAALTGRWVAGCDVCQNVCPWNDPVTPGVAFESTNKVFNAELTALAGWSAAEFKAHTAGSAMGRMKYSGFLRNVAIALANSGLSAAEKRKALARVEASLESLSAGVGRDGAVGAVRWAREKGTTE